MLRFHTPLIKPDPREPWGSNPLGPPGRELTQELSMVSRELTQELGMVSLELISKYNILSEAGEEAPSPECVHMLLHRLSAA
jgi:hypothetical protein